MPWKKRTVVVAVLGAVGITLAPAAPGGGHAELGGDRVALAAEDDATGASPAAPGSLGAAAGDPASGGSSSPAGRVATALVAKNVPRMGNVVTDQRGWILYRFDKDGHRPPTTRCNGRCASVWPPVLVEGTPRLRGVPATEIGTVLREDSTRQVTLGGWPLYYYVGDRKPGTWKGQGVGRTWFVVTRTGARNTSCLPRRSPRPVASPPTGARP